MKCQKSQYRYCHRVMQTQQKSPAASRWTGALLSDISMQRPRSALFFKKKMVSAGYITVWVALGLVWNAKKKNQKKPNSSSSALHKYTHAHTHAHTQTHTDGGEASSRHGEVCLWLR